VLQAGVVGFPAQEVAVVVADEVLVVLVAAHERLNHGLPRDAGGEHAHPVVHFRLRDLGVAAVQDVRVQAAYEAAGVQHVALLECLDGRRGAVA
jgi:hypothetical protein